MTSVDEVSTWWQHSDGDRRQHLHRVRCGETLKDTTLKRFFRFICEIDTGHGHGALFKGHYLDAPLVSVERHPRHLRPLTQQDKNNLASEQLLLTDGSIATPRVDDCDGCLKRMSVLPSPRSHNSPGPDNNPLVLRGEQGQIAQKFYCSATTTAVQEFALQVHNTLDHLKRVAKTIGLRVLSTGRGTYARNLPICGRITFGLKLKTIMALKARNVKAKEQLFKFAFHVKTGFYEPSKDNAVNVTFYEQYRREFLNTSNESVLNVPSVRRKDKQAWSPENLDILIKERCQTNPIRFKDIAQHLNALEKRSPTAKGVRPYTARDCQNKWATLFPSKSDMFTTIQYLLKLKSSWPGTVVKLELGFDKHNPIIKAAHIVWPWARETMKRLSKTVFCDATFHITVYAFKVVMLTTLDGNHQHRPLMVSFITASTGVQWQKIFNVFYR